MGKSTLLRALVLGQVAASNGLLLIDPHGDLVDELHSLIPRRRRNDVVTFDARTADACPGLNPLRGVRAIDRAVTVSGILATLRKLWPDNWGPRTEHLLRYTLLALCEVRGATLIDARDMLADETRRRWVLKQVRDEGVLHFWGREFVGYSKQLQADAVAAPLNKLGAMAGHTNVRAVLTRNRPVLEPDQCLARQRLVLARLSKGAIGEDGANLLGGLLLGQFQRATMAREAFPREARLPFSIVVDEIGSFATKPFIELLSEARKYSVSLTLATQSIALMSDDLRAGILGNVGTIVSFRVGAEDAELLEKEFAGRYGVHTLTSLEVGERVVKEGAKPAMLVPLAETS